MISKLFSDTNISQGSVATRLRCGGVFNECCIANFLEIIILSAADVPCRLEPACLSRDDGKRPDGLSLVPWKAGRCLVYGTSHVQIRSPPVILTAQSLVPETSPAKLKLRRNRSTVVCQPHTVSYRWLWNLLALLARMLLTFCMN